MRVGHFFAYVAHFLFLKDVWIRTQRAAVASRCATKYQLSQPPLSHPSTVIYVQRFLTTAEHKQGLRILYQ
jgi:hypothetical protein